jgi:hypothetical protein
MLPEVCSVLTHSGMAPIHAPITKLREERMPLHIRGRQFHEPGGVHLRYGTNGGTSQFHVLLRHRPRSIPQAQESA